MSAIDTYSRTEEAHADLPGGQTQPEASSLGLPLTSILWLLALAFLAAAAIAGWQLWLAWQTAYEPYWQQLHVALVALFILAFLYTLASMLGPFLPFLRRLFVFKRLVRGQSERVRQAATSGNDELAPLAADQPDPLPAAELPIHPLPFGPFTPSRQQRQRHRSMIGQEIAGVLICGGIIALFTVVSPLLSDSPLSFMFQLLPGIFAVMGIMSLIALALTLWQRVRNRVHEPVSTIVADDWGVRQARGERHTDEHLSLAWHEIRAFYKADDLLHLHGRVITEGAAQKTTYTIDTGDHLLQWTLWEGSTAAERADSERLCRLIATRTHLPLRDVSALATTQGLAMLDLVLPVVAQPLGGRFVYQAPGKATALSPAAPPDLRPLGRTRWSRWLTISRVAAISLAVSLLGAGMLAQGGQFFQYDFLIHQHIDREDPYYTIDFRTNDGAWPSHPATASSGSYTFAADGYHLTGTPAGGPMEAVLANAYGDATVELTAALVGDTPGEYGIVLRESNDGADKVAFSVSSSGGWMLARYHVDAAGAQQRTILLRNEHSDAVHTGRDASNWLTVIVRGDEYLCVVRDHPVGMYHDTAGLTPRQGHVGIWLGDTPAEGVYYYFSVYPAA